MSAPVSEQHVWLSSLEEELLRARDLEAAGKGRLDAQEKRVPSLKARNVQRRESQRLLDIMAQTQKLHGRHVQLLEREVRDEKSGWNRGLSPSNLSFVEVANRFLDDAARTAKLKK